MAEVKSLWQGVKGAGGLTFAAGASVVLAHTSIYTNFSLCACAGGGIKKESLVWWAHALEMLFPFRFADLGTCCISQHCIQYVSGQDVSLVLAGQLQGRRKPLQHFLFKCPMIRAPNYKFELPASGFRFNWTNLKNPFSLSKRAGSVPMKQCKKDKRRYFCWEKMPRKFRALFFSLLLFPLPPACESA